MVLAEALKLKHYKPGTAIVREGEEGHEFFIIKKGKAIVTRKDPDTKREVELGKLNAGDYFGRFASVFLLLCCLLDTFLTHLFAQKKKQVKLHCSVTRVAARPSPLGKTLRPRLPLRPPQAVVCRRPACCVSRSNAKCSLTTFRSTN